MTSAFLITAFATLFVVIDPPGLVPLFIALTQGMDAQHRAHMARRACIIAFVLLTLFGLMGETLLGFIGTSLYTYMIAPASIMSQGGLGLVISGAILVILLGTMFYARAQVVAGRLR